jgi:hypothetical protein
LHTPVILSFSCVVSREFDTTPSASLEFDLAQEAEHALKTQSPYFVSYLKVSRRLG